MAAIIAPLDDFSQTVIAFLEDVLHEQAHGALIARTETFDSMTRARTAYLPQPTEWRADVTLADGRCLSVLIEEWTGMPLLVTRVEFPCGWRKPEMPSWVQEIPACQTAWKHPGWRREALKVKDTPTMLGLIQMAETGAF